MQKLVCIQPGQFAYAQSEIPELTPGHAIIRINRIGICGTDLHAYEGTQPYFNYPRILGHELAGELVKADGAAGFEVGETVTLIPYFNCGHCIACRSDKPNCCVNMKVSGVHIDGGMVEYLSVPSYSLVHGEGLSVDELALIEPLAIGAHGVRRAQVKPGEWALVVGAGPIGLGIMEFIRLGGGNVIALDVNDDRLAYCRQQLGVQHTIQAKASDVLEQLMNITNGDMPTLVMDATGNLQAINNGFNYLAHGGRYVLVGLQSGDIKIIHPEFHKREATLMSSRNATRLDFEFVIQAVKNGSINPLKYITHRVAFDQASSSFESWLKPENRVIKAVIEL